MALRLHLPTKYSPCFLQHRSGEGCSAVRLCWKWESGRLVGKPKPGLHSGHPHNCLLQALSFHMIFHGKFIPTFVVFFSPILILAQRAWQPLPWRSSMMRGCWITRRGKTWTLIIILGQDLWLLARVWCEGKGEDNSGRPDETWGDTSQIERHEMKHFGKCT